MRSPMLRQLRLSYARFGMSSLFVRFVGVIAPTGLLLILLFSLCFYRIYSDNHVRQVIQSSKESMEQSVGALDLMFSSLYSLMEKEYKFNALLRRSMEDKNFGPHDLYNIHKVIGGIKASNQAIDSIYVYNAHRDAYFSDLVSLCPAEDFYDEQVGQMLDQMRKSSTPMTLFSVCYRPLSYSYGSEQHHANVISMVFHSESSDAAIVYNIDQQALQEALMGSPLQGAVRTFVMDAEGLIISDSQVETIYTNCVSEPYFASLSAGEESFLAEVDGRTLLVTCQTVHRYSSLHWVVVRMYDYAALMDTARGASYLLAAAMVGFVLLYMLFIYCLARWLGGPIERLLRYTPPCADGAASKDEFDLLESSMAQLSENVRNLAHTVRSPLVQNAFLLSLLYGNDDTAKAYGQAAGKLGLPRLHRVRFLAVKCDIPDGSPPKDAEALRALLEPCLAPLGPALCFDDRTYACAILPSPIHPPALLACLEDLRQRLRAEGKAVFPVGIGREVLLGELKEGYASARRAVKHYFSHTREAIVFEESLNPDEERHCGYPSDLEVAALDAIRRDSDATEAVKAFCNAIRPFPIDALLVALHQFSDRVVSALPSLEETERTKALAELRRSETLDEACARLCAHLEEDCRRRRERRGEKLLRLTLEIEQLVQAQYAMPELSIEGIAQALGLSVNYVRTLYKDSRGVSLSKYIAKVRLDAAKRLLEETDLPANRIGEMVGCSQGSYFYATFKRAVGVSPDAYRKGLGK